MFSQVKSALDRSEGGLGIGLTLVRALVELHGGRVEVESKGLGEGSTFSVVLPLAVGTAEASGAAAAGGAPDEAIVGRRRVLIADDNVDAAESLAELVRLAGHDVRIVHDGTFAVDLAREFRPARGIPRPRHAGLQRLRGRAENPAGAVEPRRAPRRRNRVGP